MRSWKDDIIPYFKHAHLQWAKPKHLPPTFSMDFWGEIKIGDVKK
jgi:hypothetical protein